MTKRGKKLKNLVIIECPTPAVTKYSMQVGIGTGKPDRRFGGPARGRIGGWAKIRLGQNGVGPKLKAGKVCTAIP